MNETDFIAFVLTHGRANTEITTATLRRRGYTGRIAYVIDNEDDQAELYYKRFGKENVFMFDKAEFSKTMDEGDNFGKRSVILYARNYCFELAKQLNIKYFIELDDDYKRFRFRFDDKCNYMTHMRKRPNLDQVFDAMIEFYKADERIKAIAPAQGGDFIGGENGNFGRKIKLHRKCMNAFLCSTARPFQFIGRVNEDVTSYTTLGCRGVLFFTFPQISLEQLETQSNKGGMTDEYLDNGTFVKSFYSVMYSPSAVKIFAMGDRYYRIHHQVNWKYAVPKLISDKYKKR